VVDGNESSVSHHQVLGTVGTGTNAKSLAVSADGTLLFVLGTNGNILIVDIVQGSGSENQVVGTVGTGTQAKSLAVSADGALLYVLQEDSDEVLVIAIEVIPGVSVIDPDAAAPSFRVETSIVHSFQAGADPSFVAIDPSGSGTVLVTNAGDGTLSIVNSTPPPPLEARFEVFPPIIIVKLKTPYITGWVQLPDGYAVRDIDVNTVRMNGTVPAIPSKVFYFDLNHDDVEDVLYTFKKSDVVATLDPEHILQTITISGEVGDRTFTGEDWLLALFPWLGPESNEGIATPGQPTRISWVTPDGVAVDYADVHVSWDGGETWEAVATQVPNTGELPWVPPVSPASSSALIMVSLWHDGEVLGQGVSLQPFRVGTRATTQIESFDVSVQDNAAVLRWETLTEASMEGFRIVRSETEAGPYAAVTEQPIALAGKAGGASYEYRDPSVRPNRTYWYKLQEVLGDGPGQEFGPYALTYRLAFGLEQNMPNPFNPTTTIRYSLAADVNVSLMVYDVAGRRVRTLVNGDQRANAYRVTWDGLNDNGERVSSGMYFYKLVAGTYTQTKKMILLK
jgi:hypothetical protein